MLANLTEANEYFHTRPRSEKWFEYSTEDRQKFLFIANRHINMLPFRGERATYSQADAFPRMVFSKSFQDGEMVNVINTPEEIKQAVFEEAYAVLLYFENDVYKFKEQGYKRTNNQGISEEFDNVNKIILSDEAKQLVKNWVVSAVDI